MCCLALSAQEKQYFDSIGNKLNSPAGAKYYATYKWNVDSPALLTKSEFYLSGQHKQVMNYSDTAKGIRHGRFEDWYENGQLLESGNFIAGKLEGDFTMYYDNGVLKRKENYTNGERNSGTCYSKGGTEIPYFEYFVPASFPGGPRGWQNYLLTTLVYPKKSIKANEQGTVIVMFIVDKDGSISDLSIDKSVSPALDKEALRVIGEMPKWKPGKLDGEIIRSFLKQPITFKLER